MSQFFRDGLAHTWTGGDFNGAPGGSNILPPVGDGVFDEDDIMASLVHGLLNTGPYTPDLSRPHGVPGQAALGSIASAQLTLVYDAATGQLSGASPEGVTLSSLLIESSGPAFALERPPSKGAFDFVNAAQLFVSSYTVGFSSIDYGPTTLSTAIPESIIRSSLSVRGTLQDGGPGPITSFAIVYLAVPLPCEASPADFIFVLDSSGRYVRLGGGNHTAPIATSHGFIVLASTLRYPFMLASFLATPATNSA